MHVKGAYIDCISSVIIYIMPLACNHKLFVCDEIWDYAGKLASLNCSWRAMKPRIVRRGWQELQTNEAALCMVTPEVIA